MPDLSFAAVFSRAVAARGLTLERLHDRLVQAGVPVTVATLSYWRTGRSEPARQASLRTIAVLESVLGMEPTGLSQHLSIHRNAERSPYTARKDIQQIVPAGALAKQILQSWGIQPNQLSSLSIQDRATITPEGTDGPVSTRKVMRAEVDDVRGYPVVLVQDIEDPDGVVRSLPPLPESPDAIDIVAVTGCSIGRIERVDEVNLIVAEMLFPRPLAKGEIVMSEHLWFPRPSAVLSDRLQRGILQSLREMVVEAHFHPTCVPKRAFRFVRESADGPEVLTEPVPIHGTVAQTVFVDLKEGLAGLRWDWD